MATTTTQQPNISNAANQAGDALKKGINDLLEMQENTAITLLTFLTFFTIIMAFLYYFYFNGTGTVGGIFMILIINLDIIILFLGREVYLLDILVEVQNHLIYIINDTVP